MYDYTEKSGFPREIEVPAEISILDTYREVCREVHPINSIAGRQKLSESIKNQLYEKIRAAFGIDMAAQSPVDIYPVFTPDRLNRGSTGWILLWPPGGWRISAWR